jgi:hypothetical protein
VTEETQDQVEETTEEAPVEKPKSWYLNIQVGTLSGAVEHTGESADFKKAIAEALGIGHESIYLDGLLAVEQRWYGVDNVIQFHLAGSKAKLTATVAPRRY